mgnify:CR=1 FL=1
MVYVLVLAVALAGGAIALYGAFGDAPPEAPVAAPESETEPTPQDEVGGVEIVDAPEGRSKAGPDFVPDLPEVPDLATQPPPAPPPEEDRDPRFAQLGAEMRLLGRARELLQEHPAEALGVLEQHRRLHPAGVLREEREAFAIEAMVMLEHVAEAERRYYEFMRDFPHSDFRGRLEELMERPPHEVGALGR